MSDFTSSLYDKLRFPAVFNRIGTFCNHGLAGNCPARVLVAGRRSLSVRLLSPPSNPVRSQHFRSTYNSR